MVSARWRGSSYGYRLKLLKNKFYFFKIMADIKKLSKNYTVIISRSDLTKHD